jgi:hypothetical protein
MARRAGVPRSDTAMPVTSQRLEQALPALKIAKLSAPPAIETPRFRMIGSKTD